MKQISEQEMEQMQNAIWEEFLTQATQAEIFFSVGTSNWENNRYLREWILEHPELDKAIALRSYWMSQPECHHLPAANWWYLDDRDLVEALEQKYVAGFWKKSRIRFDPKYDGYDWTRGAITKAAQFTSPIPEAMFRPLKGETVEVPKDFDEGLPLAFAQRINDLFDEYEVIEVIEE